MKTISPYPNAALQERLRDYIEATWHDLTRDHRHLLDALEDPKMDCRDAEGRALLYLSGREDPEAVARHLIERLGAETFSKIALRVLPAERSMIEEHGLLYLPGRYVVPGGRFNEFYGWDSYFICRGLLRGGHMALARSLVDQAVYEVEHYGAVLNANRTYYLSRSHPPMLSGMAREVYEQEQDKEWLRTLLPAVEQFYYFWRVPPHLNQATGLSRYRDLGCGPAPEVEASELDAEGRTHYDRMKELLKSGGIEDYDVSLYYDRETDTLTELAYSGDRSMRESGFDPTDRFGAMNLDVIHYAPVCLHVLLHRMEKDIAWMHRELGHERSAEGWEVRASDSATLLDRYFWNEEAGLYVDYHLGQERQRVYPFLTTFWPLWAGLASPEQAAGVVANLDLFLQPGGLEASTHVTGEQWDAPFAWAPLQLFAVDGLERYGYAAEAREIARRFTAMVAECFQHDGVLSEKYDARRCSSRLGEQITFGYSTNEPGFGWTNGVILEFLDRYS